MESINKTEFGFDAEKARADSEARIEAHEHLAPDAQGTGDEEPPKKGLARFNTTNKGVIYAGIGVLALALLGGGLMLTQNSVMLPAEVTGAKLVAPSASSLKDSPITEGVAEYKNTAIVAETNRGLAAEQSGASSIPAAGTNEFNREATAALGTATGTETPPNIPKAAVTPSTQATVGTAPAQAQTQVVAQRPVDPELTKVIQAMVAAKSMVPTSSVVKYTYQKDYMTELNAKISADNSAATSGLINNAVNPVTLATAGETVAAVLNMAINTDTAGPVKATILNGPLKGGVLLGTVARNGYTATATFTTLSFPGKGVSIPINAVNFDTEQGTVGNADSVNRHLMVRYAVKPLMAALVGIGDAFAKAQQTTDVSTIGNTSVVTTGSGTLSDRAIGAIGVGALSEQIKSDAALLGVSPTVKVNMGSTIGIIFMSDVIYSPGQTNKTLSQ